MTHNINGNYEGYIWMSDATKPTVYYPATPINIVLDDKANPFILEGELYDARRGESISFRFADGHYFINKIPITQEYLKESEYVTKKEFIAQRMPNIGKLKYLQFWEEIKDPLCENMETLQPSNLAFVGFKAEEI